MFENLCFIFLANQCTMFLFVCLQGFLRILFFHLIDLNELCVENYQLNFHDHITAKISSQNTNNEITLILQCMHSLLFCNLLLFYVMFQNSFILSVVI